MNAASFLVNTAASGLIKMKLHFPPYEAVNKLLDELVQKRAPAFPSSVLGAISNNLISLLATKMSCLNFMFVPSQALRQE
jgi:hypothetical protein